MAVDRHTGKETDQFQPQKRTKLYGVTVAYAQCPSGDYASWEGAKCQGGETPQGVRGPCPGAPGRWSLGSLRVDERANPRYLLTVSSTVQEPKWRRSDGLSVWFCTSSQRALTRSPRASGQANVVGFRKTRLEFHIGNQKCGLAAERSKLAGFLFFPIRADKTAHSVQTRTCDVKGAGPLQHLERTLCFPLF